MRTNKLILAIAFTATAAAFATDYTWNGKSTGADWNVPSNWAGGDGTGYPGKDDKAIFPASDTEVWINLESPAEVGELVLNGPMRLRRATFLTIGSISGNAKLVLANGARIKNANSQTLTIANEVNIVDSTYSTTSTAVPLIYAETGDIVITGPITGDGAVNLQGANGTSYGVKLSGDNSGFSGTVAITNKGRTQFLSANAGSEDAHWILQGNAAQNGSAEFTEGTLKFGSLKTEVRNVTTTAWRFTKGNIINVEIGKLNASDDRISLPMGWMSSAGGKPTSGLVKIRKVGSGTLELWHPGHVGGTEINGGTVLVTSRDALNGRTNDVSAAWYYPPITFTGGTLKYGVDKWNPDGTARDESEYVNVASDWSALVTNSTSAITVENDWDVTWATAIDDSNVGGFTKKGKGTLTLNDASQYSGTTTVSEGTLAFPITIAEGTEVWPAVKRTGTIAEGAKLAYVVFNGQTLGSKRTTNPNWPDLPVGATIEYNNSNQATIPRIAYVSASDFTGTLNFNGTLNASTAAGIVDTTLSLSVVGGEGITWNVNAEPNDYMTNFWVSVKNGVTAKLGAINHRSAKSVINTRANNALTLEIGEKNEPSVMNGVFDATSNLLTIRKVGTSTLTLGSGFAVWTTNANAPTLTVANGELKNNANLSDWSVSFANDVTLSGSGRWPENVTMPASYHVAAVAPGETPETLNLDVDFSKATLANEPTAESVAGLNEDTSYTIFTAKSISNWTTQVIKDDRHGKWKVVKQGNSLVLKYSKKAFVIILR